jgi:hypothetical protein
MKCLAVSGVLALLAAGSNAGSLAAQWALEVGSNAESWDEVATLTVDSTNEIADEYATSMVHPQLEFRCTPGADGTLEVRIDWRRYISSFNTEVGFKADDKELLLVNWGVDKSKKITMPRAARDNGEVINYLKGASRLQVEVIPYAESLITVSYDISGIDAALQALADKCR